MPAAKLHLLAALLLLTQIPIATAEEVSIPCHQDITLYEDLEGNISNGAGQHLFVGKTLRGPLRRALLSFDLADFIPAGTTVTAVQLSFTVSQTQGGPQTLTVQRVLRTWGESASDANEPEGQGIEAVDGDATWLHTFYPDSLWATPGGDFAATSSASLIVDGGGAYTSESTGTMVADVQGWLDEPQHNFGWVLLGNETDPKTAKRFFAREHETASKRPILLVTFNRDAATATKADSWGKIKAAHETDSTK